MERKAIVFKCLGRCGVEGCDKTYKTKQGLTRHLKPKEPCPICAKMITSQNIPDHIRTQHEEHVHLIRSYIPCPFPGDRERFAYVKKMVHSLLRADLRSKRIAEMPGPHVTHNIACDVYLRWRSMSGDDAGGHVKPRLQCYHIYQLSLDRKNNKLPHFVDNGLSNLSLVILGVNNRAEHRETKHSLVGVYGNGTVAEFFRRRNMPVDLDAIMARETKTWNKGGNNVVYRSCMHAYQHDKKTRKQFKTGREFFHHGLELLRAQGGRCAISNIPMDGHKGSPTSFFQPSLDAIKPKLGHVRGNLRWVIMCLNATDCAKKNPNDSENSRWTKAKFLKYIGVRAHKKRRLGLQIEL